MKRPVKEYFLFGFAFLLLEDALDYSRAHKRTNSHRNDLCQMKRLLEWFGDRPTEAISAQEIEQRLLTESNWAPATVNRYRALLSLTYRLAIRNAKANANPVRFVQRRLENNVRLRFLSPQEEESLRAILQATHPEQLPEFDLALHTGLRLGEQYGLRWEDVEFERRMLTIPRSKNGDMRYVPLNGTAMLALKALRARNGNSALVCGGVKSPRRWFRSAVMAAGLRGFTWHCLRHTFASRLVMAGVDLRSVQELGGWKMLAMVARYAHLAPGHLQDAVERLARNGTDTRTGTGAMAASAQGQAYVH